jgi:protein ImuB
VERLQARLGRERVLRIQPVPDHRPECGTQLLPLDAAEAARSLKGGNAGWASASAVPQSVPRQGLAAAFTRPFWLYHPPMPLPRRQALPWLDGRPLVVLAGPERIETGWWDDAPVARDYFIAQAQDGSLVWVYRSRLPASDDEGSDDDDGDTAAQAALPGTGPRQQAVARGGGWFLQGRFG